MSELKDLRLITLKMADRLSGLAGSAIDTIKINQIRREKVGAREYWVKRRRQGSSTLIRGANLFFYLAENPVSVLRASKDWQAWEVESFHLLHGDEFGAFVGKNNAVWADQLPGVDLSTSIKRHTLTSRMLCAAGHELSRAHRLWSRKMGALWSHGDPHLGNFIFDEGADRARLIDFETMHDPFLPAQIRHADDLSVLLLDMLGRVSEAEWLEMAQSFLLAYGDRNVIRTLKERFVMPFGFRRLWWAIRTSYVPGHIIRQRLETLSKDWPDSRLI